MAQLFDIMTTTDSVILDEQGRGKVAFTVHNPGGVNRTAEFTIILGGSAQTAWFTFSPSEIVPAQGQRVIEVMIDVPANQRKTRHEFRLQAVDQADPRGDHVQSKGITIARGKTSFPWWIPVAASIIVIVGVILAIGMKGCNKKIEVPVEPTPIPYSLVPNLEGHTLADAQNIAQELGFELEHEPYATLVKEPAGTVKTQIPEYIPGLLLPKKSTLRVTLVKDWIEVPSIITLTISDAMQLLNSKGFFLDMANAIVGDGVTEVKLTSVISNQKPPEGLIEKQSGVTPKIIPYVGTGRLRVIDRSMFEVFKRDNISFMRRMNSINPDGGD